MSKFDHISLFIILRFQKWCLGGILYAEWKENSTRDSCGLSSIFWNHRRYLPKFVQVVPFQFIISAFHEKSIARKCDNLPLGHGTHEVLGFFSIQGSYSEKAPYPVDFIFSFTLDPSAKMEFNGWRESDKGS